MSGGKTAATVLRDAVEVLRERGWIQGRFRDEQGRCCAVGAMRVADGAADNEMLSDEGAIARLTVIEMLGTDGVTDWSDAEGRTQAEVEAALFAAAARLDAGSGEPQ